MKNYLLVACLLLLTSILYAQNSQEKILADCPSGPTILNINACNSYSLNNQTYLTSGKYFQRFPITSTNCDSVVEINLIIENGIITRSTVNASACSTYTLNGQKYIYSGTYQQRLKNYNGCDSILTLNLTITKKEARIIRTGTMLQAENFKQNNSYQWYTCSNNFVKIPNATNSTFQPSGNGEYSVVITNDGCPDTSTCYSYRENCSPENLNFEWVNYSNFSNSINAIDMTIDQEGNQIIIGSFSPNTDFDFGISEAILKADNSLNGFIAKYDKNGKFLWVRQLTGMVNCENIQLDYDGNIFVCGDFFITTDFNPGLNVVKLTPVNGMSMFLLKLDKNGDFLWVDQFNMYKSRSGTAVRNHSLAIDHLGNAVVVGLFEGSADFDPGVGSLTLTSAGHFDLYIMKMKATGAFAWAKQIGSNNEDTGIAVGTDLHGNICFSGAFSNTVDLNPGKGTMLVEKNVGHPTRLLVQLDSTGEFMWGKSTLGEEATEIKFNDKGELFICGVDEFDFTHTSPNTRKGMIEKLDATGNIIWKNTSSHSSNFKSMALGNDGSIYTGGIYKGNISVGNMPAFQYKSDFDIMIVKWASIGYPLWYKTIGGNGFSNFYSIACDPANNIYTLGTSSSIIDLDPSISSNIARFEGFSDPFIQKFSQCENKITGLDSENKNSHTNNLVVYPNPSTGEITITDITTLEDNSEALIKIINVLGKVVFEGSFIAGKPFDTNLLIPGLYTILVMNDNTKKSIQWVKI